MVRDLDRLTAHTFDVLVVGGGIYGLTIAYDAAQRGLSVALIECHDFGSGSSFNHLRTIHGGLRYLQTFDLARARESIAERRTLARIAPAAVQPLPFVLPLPASLTRGPLAMRAAFILDAVIARERNRDLPASHNLPGGRVIGRVEAVAQFPTLQGMALTGAAIWHDYITTEADRLTLSWALAAASHDAVLANYVEATTLLVESGRAAGVRAVDRRTGRELALNARVTVNATGFALDRLLQPCAIQTGMPVLKAMNLVTRLQAPAAAFGGRGPSGRTLFLVPWKGRALFGTWESGRPYTGEDPARDADEIDRFIAELNAAFPSVGLRRDDVTLVHRGLVPAAVASDGTATLEGHEQIHDHATRGVEGLVSVAGTKYTTARAVAERVTDRLLEKLGRSRVACRTMTVPLPWSPSSGDALLTEAARGEMVVTLEDAVVRRTPLGALGHPGEAVLRHAATVVGDVLGWDAATREREVVAVGRFYEI